MVRVLYANGASSGHRLVNDFFGVISNPSLLLKRLRSLAKCNFLALCSQFFILFGRAQTVECWCMQMGLVGIGATLWWNCEQAANAGKTKPTSSASFTAVKSNQTFFLSLQCLSKFRVLQCRGVYRICASGTEHCAQCNRVWGPRSRFRCNPTFNFSIKGKGMAPALKLI